jgi:hypothetical protein
MEPHQHKAETVLMVILLNPVLAVVEVVEVSPLTHQVLKVAMAVHRAAVQVAAAAEVTQVEVEVVALVVTEEFIFILINKDYERIRCI